MFRPGLTVVWRFMSFFFFNDTATTEIYTLSLHDALPIIGRGRAPIKARLMDQAVMSGIGNLMADEILWRTHLDPRRPADELGTDELDRLWREMRSIIRMSVRRGHAGISEVIPERRRDGHCPRCGTAMERATVGGRTTYWCPKEQH